MKKAASKKLAQPYLWVVEMLLHRVFGGLGSIGEWIPALGLDW